MPGYTVYNTTTGKIDLAITVPEAEKDAYVGPGQALYNGFYPPSEYHMVLSPLGPALNDPDPAEPLDDTVPPGGTTGQVLRKASSTDFDTEWGDFPVPSRGAVVLTTASLANNATEVGTVALGKTFALIRTSADRPCRVRLYGTNMQLIADSGRAIGTDPIGEHGVICDLAFVTGNLVLDLAPMVFGACQESTVSANIPYSITNTSGSTSTVAVTFTKMTLEA